MKNSTWSLLVLSTLSIFYLAWPDECTQCPVKDKEIGHLKKQICKANSDTLHKNCFRIGNKK